MLLYNINNLQSMCIKNKRLCVALAIVAALVLQCRVCTRPDKRGAGREGGGGRGASALTYRQGGEGPGRWGLQEDNKGGESSTLV